MHAVETPPFRKKKKLKQASELWNPKIMRVLHFLIAKKQSRGQEFFTIDKIMNLPTSW